MASGNSSPVVVELSEEAARIVQYMLATNNKGVTIEAMAKDLKLSLNTAKLSLSWLKKLSKSVRVKRKGGKVLVFYNAPNPSIHVTMAPAPTAASNGATAAPKKSKSEPATPSTPGAQIITSDGFGGKEKADLVWPPAPEIPDIGSKYSWYTKAANHDDIYNHMLVHGHNLRIAGPPSSGKSSVVEFIAASENIPLANVNAQGGLRQRDLIGKMTDLGVFEVTEFASMVVFGGWGKIDEANAMDPDAALALNSLLAPPYQIVIHGKAFPVNPAFRLVITYNPGLIGTKPLPESLKDRLYPYRIGFPKESQLKKMLKANGVLIDEPKAQNLISFAMLMDEKRNKKQTRFDITIRGLLFAWSDIKDGLPVDSAIQKAIIAGIDTETEQVAVNNILVENMKTWK